MLLYTSSSTKIKKEDTFFANTIVMNLASSIKIIAGLLPWAAGPPYSAVLPVPNPNS